MRDQFRQETIRREKAADERYMRGSSEGDDWDRMLAHASNSQRELDRRQADEDAGITRVSVSDAVSGYYKRSLDEHGEAIKDPNALAVASNLVLRDSEVGACIDRTYEGTLYTSRLKFSPWVRKELPTSLKPFMQNTPNRHADARRLLLQVHP